MFYLKLVSMTVEMDPFGLFEPNWSKKVKLGDITPTRVTAKDIVIPGANLLA